ncbi:MFS general substrate transporter [Microstroma glucosiphilum]|uniref:MFS general substrate transporter n=1 Tax=Pseudomicrostroma glucosiphilum TaxID=1684307 RepID=A0A316UB47_9BASI|nr:MFS general substrate transporter [Pseudomicrostroma glucosiphilum]PWN22074.1 MFS general substrate transporter [Pseudomicrostroma glucosiphilum]
MGLSTSPHDWPASRKWSTVLSALLFTYISTLNVIGYPLLGDSVAAGLHTSDLAVQTGNTTYLVALAATPLLLAPLSERHGRKPVFIIACALYTVFTIPQALARNVGVLIAFRFLSGAAASVGSSMAGGVVADVFTEADRAFPMAMYAFAVWAGQGTGPVITALTLASRDWRVVFWWNTACGGLCMLVVVLCMTECRTASRRRINDGEAGKVKGWAGGIKHLGMECWHSLCVPLGLLARNSTVQSLSLWSAFVWSVTYIYVQAIPVVFSEGYKWTLVEETSVMVAAVPAGLLGLAANWHQGRIYHDRSIAAGRPLPEARLHYACAGAVLVPVGLVIFAWTGQPNISPGWPIFGYFLFSFGIFPIYLSLFSFLADIFEERASSAMAAQSFCRNILSATLPLASAKMYSSLGSPVATTVLASIAAVLAVVPFVLKSWHGKQGRKLHGQVTHESDRKEVPAAAAVL